ncbi:MAG TPA: CBS domain-containing protein [Desulfuromonadales bacterium]|nr:CBS domain-containing protein [Desulfuromonadales bacterium]
MKVGEICNREVVFVDREAAILEAAQLMRRHHVGDVVVTEERAGIRVPVGILTDRDIVVELLAEQIPLEAVAVGDAMSSELLTVSAEEEVMDALLRMRGRGVRRAPVVDPGGALAGILAVDDLIDLVAEQLSDLVKLIGNEQQRELQRRG